MIELPVLAVEADLFASADLVPLHIRCSLNSPITSYDPVMFDGILAAAVVRRATEGRMLPKSDELYHIPLPLMSTDVNGIPIWWSTVLRPVGEAVEDIVYLHRRAQTGQFTAGKKGRFSPNTSVGRWMERRVPTPVTVADELEAFVIGDHGMIASLLTLITHVGKRRAAGFGAVRQWTIAPAERFPIVWSGIGGMTLSRALPTEARTTLAAFVEISAAPSLVSVTPPYWHPRAMMAGWPAGTPASQVPAFQPTKVAP